MRIGIQLYGLQLPPSAGTTAMAPGRGGEDVYRLVSEGTGADFLLIGGSPPGASNDLERAGDLIVPLAAAALAMGAPSGDMVVKLSAWAFDAAHVARIGANLARLTGDRCALYLDAEPGSWSGDDKDRDAEKQAQRMQEFLAIVFQHWSGRADFSGHYLRSIGRMVGPRPERGRPRTLLDAALVAQPGADLSPDGTVVPYGAGVAADPAHDVIVTCPVILGRTAAEARGIAAEMRSLSAARCVIGDVEDVVRAITALGQRPRHSVAVGFPAMRAGECRLFRDAVLPRLRGSAGAGSMSA